MFQQNAVKNNLYRYQTGAVTISVSLKTTRDYLLRAWVLFA